MRLLESSDGKFKLTKDLVRDIPRYAILSHTWGLDTEEVTFRDLADGTGEDKIGYEKIRFCAEQASRDEIQYFWVDTCCIDKSNHDELSRAINSMFRWYQNASRCYVYLSGISAIGYENNPQPGLAWESPFREHRWFTRGWTLQELLAPALVEFFTEDGQRLGDKRSLEQLIHEITGIAVPALRGSDLSQFGVEERFRWAEKRQTTHEEDWAYCLLGIFGIFMPFIPGEGKEHAIRRLKREIADASRTTPSCASTDKPETTAPLRYNPSDFYTNGLASVCKPPSYRIVISESGKRLLAAGATWDLIVNHELFRRGLVDVGSVSNHLRPLAMCDGEGPVFKEEDIVTAIEQSVVQDELL